jgi:hypothetical protein
MHPRLLPAALALLTAPVLAGAGTCGIIYDTSQLQLVLEPVEAIDVASDAGALEVYAFDRTGVVVSYHLFGYDASLKDVDHAVDGDRLEVFMLKGGPAEVTADFYLEAPLATDLTFRVDDGPVKLTGVSGTISGTVGVGDVDGVHLLAPDLDLEVASGAVTLEFLARPTDVRVIADAGDIALTLPAGAYRCDLDAEAEPVLKDITCDDAADASLVLAASGQIHLEGTAP